MRSRVLPGLQPGSEASAAIDAAVAALPTAAPSPTPGAPSEARKRAPTASPPATTAVARWRTAVDDFMSQIKNWQFGDAELEAMASLGGASGKAWNMFSW